MVDTNAAAESMTAAPAEPAWSVDWPAFVRRWAETCSADNVLGTWCAESRYCFAIRCGDDCVTFHFDDGRLLAANNGSNGDNADFSVVAPPAAWALFLQAVPPPRHHNLFAMLMRVPGVSIEGNQLRYAQVCHVVRRVLELARALASGSGPAAAPRPEQKKPSVEPVSGGYVNLDVEGEAFRLYFETAGEGRDLLCLHTAGADSRQFYRLMNDSRLTDGWRVTAFDLPGHGKSFPAPGSVAGSWRLTTDRYVNIIMALAATLDLQQPVALGASMAGEICLELAYRHPLEFSAVVACQASDHIVGRQVAWARHPEVNQTTFVPEWVHGLIAPTSPAACAEEIWWGYSQGGFGIFYGDILFYSGDWDARERVGSIDTTLCPVYMLTGEYDYSCTPEHSAETAANIDGAEFQVMPGLGHFPIAENPERFLQYLLPVLDKVPAASPR